MKQKNILFKTRLLYTCDYIIERSGSVREKHLGISAGDIRKLQRVRDDIDAAEKAGLNDHHKFKKRIDSALIGLSKEDNERLHQAIRKSFSRLGKKEVSLDIETYAKLEKIVERKGFDSINKAVKYLLTKNKQLKSKANKKP